MTREPPQEPTELIYLPTPAWAPVIAAFGLLGVSVGIFTWMPYFVIAAIVLVLALLAWLRGNRNEIAAMPRHQRLDSAPIPLPPPRS